jgi:hypothetical protein
VSCLVAVLGLALHMQGMQLQQADKMHPHEQHNASSPAEVATSAASHSLPAPLLTRMFMRSIADYDASARALLIMMTVPVMAIHKNDDHDLFLRDDEV